jgi:hypothetical protein
MSGKHAQAKAAFRKKISSQQIWGHFGFVELGGAHLFRCPYTTDLTMPRST